MAGTSRLAQLLTSLRRTGAPLTFSLLALEVATFMLFFLASGGSEDALHKALAFTPDTVASQPWTVITYAFTWPGGSVWLALFVFLGLYYFASVLERGMGTRTFAALVVCLTATSSLAVWVGAAALRADITLSSAALPTAALIVSWATRYPESVVMLWFVIPMKAKWLGWFTAVVTALAYGWGNPALSVFLVVPLAIAHFWVRGGVSLPSVGASGSKRDGDRLSAWERRRKEEAEKLRLKELFERSYRENEEGEDEKE